ncbi:pyrimidine-nucleoside phosphorylase [Clostridia bacterium]|nr:pyrimidine-nucleoside phosphorylase [Clostridia bacterium]
MRAVDIIRKKRDGLSLNKEEIDFFIKGVASGEVPDYQISALTMAIYFQHMTEEEMFNLTMAVVEAGEQLDLSSIKGIPVDKHSTGGVGDKVSLVLGPLVASAGVPVAKMSGRGLGHTGGTVDKLESIPGFQCELEKNVFIKQINEIQVGIISQTGNLAPADKKMYAIRDVTATVENTALIAASVVSKKLAAGNKNIVFDVKVGKGAFMKTEPRAIDLAKTMVDLVARAGGKSVAVISQMNQPLGQEVGNANEVMEAIETLKNRGPLDLTNLCLTLGSQMLTIGGRTETPEEARKILIENLENGSALKKFKEMVEHQGGNAAVVDDYSVMEQPTNSLDILAEKAGWVTSLDAMKVGGASSLLGAGRRKKGDEVDHSAGIHLAKKEGDPVEIGEVLCTFMWSNENADIEAATERIREAYYVSMERPQARPIVLRIVE